MSTRRPIVAIDGPSGSGKSTISKLVARRLGFLYIDTGAMYRCVGLRAMEAGADAGDATRVAPLLAGLAISFAPDAGGQRVIAGGRDVTGEIRKHAVSQAASKVAALPVVREKLVAMQREMGRAGGVVMEGRDIGTNVFPDAEVKVFLTASAEERARRRVLELERRGEPVDFAAVLADQKERDARDASRETDPLVAAADARRLDTTGMTIEEVVEVIAAWAEEARGK